MRMRHSEDYITVKAASPRTGLISPSASEVFTTSTPLCPGEAISLYSPYPSFGSAARGIKSPMSQRTASQRWHCDEKGWWMGVAAAKTVSRTVSASSLSTASLCPPSTQNVSPPSTDRFVVRMPTAQEPQPYDFPGHTEAQIRAYQHYARKAERLSTQEYGNNGSNAIAPSETRTHQTQVHSPAANATPRIIELDATPPHSPPSASSATFSAVLNNPTPPTSISRKPVGSAPSTAPSTHTRSTSTPTPSPRLPALPTDGEVASPHTRGLSSPSAFAAFTRDIPSPTPHPSSPLTPSPLPRAARPLPRPRLARPRITRGATVPLPRPTPSSRLAQAPTTYLFLERGGGLGARLQAVKNWAMVTAKVFLVIYLVGCMWHLLDAVREALRTMLWPVKLIWALGRWVVDV